MGKQVWWQSWWQGSRSGNTLEPWHKPDTRSKWPNPLHFFGSPCPEYPCHTVYFPVFYQKKLEGKILPFRKARFQGCHGARNMGMEEAMATGPNFNRPVKDLVYKDLLTSTFTQASHDRGIKTWRVSASYPVCLLREQVSVWIVQCRVPHGPRHWKSNNW